jgi:hypothetical protein
MNKPLFRQPALPVAAQAVGWSIPILALCLAFVVGSCVGESDSRVVSAPQFPQRIHPSVIHNTTTSPVPATVGSEIRRT